MANDKAPNGEQQAPKTHQTLPTESRAAPGACVVVACKYPPGFMMRVFEMVKVPQASPMGSIMVMEARQIGEPIKINGTSTPPGMIRDDPLVAGYALTRGVPKEMWDLWVEQNRDSDMVRNKLVFAHEKPDMVQGRAVNQRKNGVQSGMEGLDPKNPPKFGRLPVTTFTRTETDNAA
jgi:hypothetical protein